VESTSRLLGNEKLTMYHFDILHMTIIEPSSECIFMWQVALLVNEEPRKC